MSDSKGDSPMWEQIQKKTFTKWINNHLKKTFGTTHTVTNILEDWDTGLMLMYLCVALYKENEKNPEQEVRMPTLKPAEQNPKSRIQKVNNAGRGIALLKQAGVNCQSVSPENLVDHDKVAILGMVWIIILDYAARGFGGTASEVKRALLDWVNKMTNGYERVNPPGVKNFTKDWRSGLAWCALIHRHRPELLNYDECLGKSNAENLEKAFSVADEHLGIPRLLDVEDVDNDTPDDKSIMTYVMEYFHAFASEGLKESAAKQAADWLKLIREIVDLQNDYERRARALLAWIETSRGGWSNYNFGSTIDDATNAFNDLRTFIGTTKPPQEMEKMDLEALFAQIQTTRSVNGLAKYVPPAEVMPEQLESKFLEMVADQNAHATAVRENRFKFIEKKDDTVSAEIEAKISESFKRYDANNNGSLNKTEFDAACMEMSIVLKNQEEKDALFSKVAQGDDTVTFEEYAKWMKSKLVVSMDDPEGIKQAFKIIANDGVALNEAQLATKPFTDEDVAFLKENMPKNADGSFDYSAFVDKMVS